MTNEINLEPDEVVELEVPQNRKFMIFLLCELFYAFFFCLYEFCKEPDNISLLFGLFVSPQVFYVCLTLWAKKMVITSKRIIFYGLWKTRQMKLEVLEKVFCKKIFFIAEIYFWGIDENKNQIIMFPVVSHFSSIKEKLEEILGKELQ